MTGSPRLERQGRERKETVTPLHRTYLRLYCAYCNHYKNKRFRSCQRVRTGQNMWLCVLVISCPAPLRWLDSAQTCSGEERKRHDLRVCVTQLCSLVLLQNRVRRGWVGLQNGLGWGGDPEAGKAVQQGAVSGPTCWGLAMTARWGCPDRPPHHPSSSRSFRLQVGESPASSPS